MERKLATVLFVDLVESTALLAASDPEVVRRRVQRFFDQVQHCITTHGGIVEKFAGDAVMAAFGIPLAHEDDAERGIRSALAIREPVGPIELRGFGEPVTVYRALYALDGGRALGNLSAPLVGRDSELELLQNTYERAVRDRRAHVFTIYGEPGVGKSRLAAEFSQALEGATVITGRCLPYGEAVTYWPLAEMVKASAGITDDEPLGEAQEKLRACCEDEVVADLLGLAVGVLEAVEEERSQQEIAWAAREWAEQLAAVQPLVLVFEDVHWAEEPLLELVEHLAAWVRDAPLLLVCLARPELLDVRPDWGGGRLRATAIELEPLPPAESEQLADELLSAHHLPDDVRELVLEKTEGNPLFV